LLASTERGGNGQLPRLFSALAAHLGRPHVLRTDGLFRVSAEVARVRALRARLDAGEHESVILAELDARGGEAEAHVAAALLRLFLRELPEPACTFALYRPFVRAGAEHVAAGSEGAVPVLRALVAQLPPAHQALLRCTAELLAAAAVEEPFNRMTTRSLSTVFAPNLLRTMESTLAGLQDLGATTAITCALIERRDAIFTGDLHLELPPPPPPLPPLLPV